MSKARVLNVRVIVRSLEQVASDLDVVLTALKALPSVNVDLGPLKAGGRRIGQVLVGRQCTKDMSIIRPTPADQPRKLPKRGPL